MARHSHLLRSGLSLGFAFAVSTATAAIIGITGLVGVSAKAASPSAADQQWHIEDILSKKDAQAINAQRAQCAMGRAESVIANARQLGLKTLPDAAPWCIATLIRAGRDHTLGYVRDPSNAHLTPSLAFDNGFVTGYGKRASVPSDAPSMAALQDVATRCLGQHESNTSLCNAAGYAVGARAAQGETPIVR